MTDLRHHPVPGGYGVIDLNDARPQATAPDQQQGLYDLDELTRRLAEHADRWVPQLFPGGRREGPCWRLANIEGRPPHKHGSCEIGLEGEFAGWHTDWETGERGAPLKTVARATGLSGRALFDYAAGLVGAPAPERKTGPKRKNTRAADIEREITFLLSQAVPLPGTLAATYLASRGLSTPATADLRFHPSATYHDTATGYPALIAVVRDAAGRQLGIHRTFLRPDGSAKAEVQKPRMMLGPVSGGAVQLAPLDSSPVLGLAEGIETGLSVLAAYPALPVWAALSAGNLEKFEPPAQVRRIVLLADHDCSGAGIKAANRAAQRHVSAGRRVWIARPPQLGDDFNDLLRRDGAGAVHAAVGAALEWTGQPILMPGIETSTPVAISKPGRFTIPAGTLPVIRADDGDLARVAGRAWSAVYAANDPPWLFLYGGHPTWIESDDSGNPQPVPMTENRLRFALARLGAWVKQTPAGELVPAHPPLATVKDILAMPDPELPVLTGIVTVPVFGPDGTLQVVPGYYPSSRLIFEPPPEFVLPAIPDRPTADDIARARAFLLDDLLGDFPFVGDAERAHTLALLLLPFVRPLIQGSTPLHLIEKPEAGTGAGLLVELVAKITTNAAATVMTEGTDEEEWRKRITAKLRSAPTLLLLDNLRHNLDCSALAAAITATSWEDRILGASETARIPVRCVWIATGNNPQFSHEISRRMVRIRMDAKTEEPWRRDVNTFRHPDILGWVEAERSNLIAACLVLGRAWIAAGRPNHKRTIGSFEAWSRVIGGILEVAGVQGFLGNLDEAYAVSDSESRAQRIFITAWWTRFGAQPVGTADLFETAILCDPPVPLGDGNDRSQRIRLGKHLSRLRDCIVRLDGQDVRVTALGIRHQAQQWALLPCDPKSDGKGWERRTDPPRGGNGRECQNQHSPDGGNGGEYRNQHSPLQTPADQGVGEYGNEGNGARDVRGPALGEALQSGIVAVHSQENSPGEPTSDQCVGECGEDWECFSYPPHMRAHACTRIHAHAHEPSGRKHSPTLPHSPPAPDPPPLAEWEDVF